MGMDICICNLELRRTSPHPLFTVGMNQPAFIIHGQHVEEKVMQAYIEWP